MNWLDQQCPLELRERSGGAEPRVNILDCLDGGQTKASPARVGLPPLYGYVCSPYLK